MKILVSPHKCEIVKTPVNEKEINVTKVEFEFSEEITDEYVKDVYFTLGDKSYQVTGIQGNECDIPYEVLESKGQVEIGVVAYLLENDEYVKRYNPSPVYISTLVGSLKDKYENYEEVTPSDKEQMEQALQEMEVKIDNLDIDAEKVDTTTTVTITKKDGTPKEVEILDGVSLENMEIQNRDLLVTYGGNKNDLGQIEPNVQVGTTTTIAPSLNARVENVGTTLNPVFNFYIPKGEAGSIKFDIVEQLPTEDIELDTIYLVPYAKVTVQELPTENIQANTIYIVSGTGKRYIYQSNQWIEIASDNQYLEYIYVNNQWEELGSIGVDIDLTDYYTKSETNTLLSSKVGFTDYATTSKAGVIQLNHASYGTDIDNGKLRSRDITYENYANLYNTGFISKGTLENVITGKGLVSNTDYATSVVGGVVKTGNGIYMLSGVLTGSVYDYSNYQTRADTFIISKGTLENVISGKGLINNNYLATSSTPGLVYATNNINYGNIGVNQYGMLFLSTTTGDSLQGAIESNTRSIPILSGNFREACGYLDLTTKSYVDGLVGNLESILETLDIGTGV